jgi:Uma2 family endonuclease
MDTVEHRSLSPEQYLALEAQSPIRHEYFAGEAHAMTGGTRRHNVICLNLAVALRDRLQGRPCQVFMADVKLKVAKASAYCYPDVFVLCGADAPVAADDVLAEDPVLVVEVLSPASEATDRREKLAAYRLLPGLREYALIAQDRRRVEIYRREGDLGWLHVAYGDADVVELASLAVGVPIASLYAGTDVAE